MSSRYVLGEKLHLLRHAALHDGVVLIEAHGQSLAIENLLADTVFHHGLKLSGSRLAMPLRKEIRVHLLEFIKTQNNLLRRFDSAAASMHVGVDSENRDPD